MKYISLFSGIECASVAWAALGWEPICFSEIEPFPSAVLAHRFPGVPNVGDMTKHDWSRYHGQCDVVIGGSPCQAFSVAGLRRSLEDDRGNLTLAYVRACNDINPAICVWENVPGIYSSKGNPFGCFLGGMVGAADALGTVDPRGRWPGAGVVVGPRRVLAWNTLDSQYFGVPQRRRRVFCVAVALAHPAFAPGKVPNPAAILFKLAGLCGDSSPGGAAGQDAVGPLGCRAPARGGPDHGGAGENPAAAVTAGVPDEVVPAVTSKWAKGSGGPAGDETQNLVVFHATQDPTQSHDITPAIACGSSRGQGSVAVAMVTGAVPVDLRNAQRDQSPNTHVTGSGLSGREGDPAFAVATRGNKQAVAIATTEAGNDGIAVPILEVGKRTGMGGVKAHAGSGIGAPGDPMFTLQASAKHGVAYTPEAEPEVVAIRLAQTSSNGCGISPGLTHTLDQSTPDAVAYREGDDGFPEVAHTLRGRGFDASEDGTGRGTPLVVDKPDSLAVRRLTPRECERLQGLPDDHTLIPYGKNRRIRDLAEMAEYWRVSMEMAKTLAADSLRYKAVGNGMAVPCVWWLGKRIEWVLQRLSGWDGTWEDVPEYGGLFRLATTKPAPVEDPTP